MITLENDDNQKAKEELISLWRREYNDNQAQSHIENFNNQSLDDNAKNAIWWYTRNSFVYRCINTVVRKENISNVYNYRYIIKLLCQQTKYNGFTSTTKNKDIAMTFSFRHRQEGYEPVLFEIEVNTPNEHDVIFADIGELSQFPQEEEILFSIGTIFRIKSVKFHVKKQLHQIRLLLTPLDQLTVIKYINQTYSNDRNWSDQTVLFGKLVFDMGEYEFAIKYFTDALNHLSDINDNLRATYLNNLGVCYNEIGSKDKALDCYLEACEIYKKTNNHHGLGTSYHNIGSIYHSQGEYTHALTQTLKALDYRQEKSLEKAATLDLLGCIYLALNNIEAAQDKLRDALTMRLKCLRQINPNHPDIGVSYQNLGGLNRKVLNLVDAYKYYLQAAEIYRHNYPKSHRMVKNISKCLKEIKKR